MRIAIWHNLPSGGGKRALHDHVRGLAERGHQVESWSPPTANLAYMPLSPYAREHVVPLEVTDPPRTGRVACRLYPYRRKKAEILAMEQHSRECAQAIDEAGFDILYGNTCSWFAAPSIGRFTQLPAVLYLQEPYRVLYEAFRSRSGRHQPWALDHQHELPRGLVRSLKWRAAYYLEDMASLESHRLHAQEESRNIHAFDRVLCNSIFSRENMMRTYGKEASTCYLGIDFSAFAPSPLPKEPYIIGLGAFAGVKGVDIAIRSVAAITRAHRPRLIWVGNNSFPDYLQQIVSLANELEVDFQPVHMATQEQLVDLLGRAAAMIYPARLEPFGYAPLEANGCGTTVVGLAEGGIRESIVPGKNGVLVNDPDPALFAQALEPYLLNLERARSEGRTAREHVLATWDVRQGIDRLEQFLGMTLAAKKLSTQR